MYICIPPCTCAIDSYNKDITVTGTNEPTVWVGLMDQFSDGGRVNPEGAYPTAYQSTLRAEWSYTAVPTGDFDYGGRNVSDG